MRRPTAVSSLFNVIKTGLAGAIALSMVLSCSESPESGVITSPPNGGITRVHVVSTDIILPDSLKYGSPADVSANNMVPVGAVADVLAAPFSPAATIAAGACAGSGAAPEYTLSRLPLPYTPEPSPNVAAFASDVTEDGVFSRPIGFNFTFHGNTYSSVNIFSNGFLTFGAPPASAPANGGNIAAASTPNNMIALAWADWSPQRVADGIRFETRGTAPNRKFILQFNNVPEFNNTGSLMSQVVLTEGTNDITIYTNKMSTTNSGHVITQGIENATGTYARYDTFLNTTLNRELARVKNRFALQNDAIRFTPVSTKDEVPPTWTTAPTNLEAYNDPHLATAVVAVVPPTAEDLCSPVTVSGVRSDGVASLDAPYPVGVTTITWTAKDAEQNAITATQTVTVIDNEDPIWTPSTLSTIEVNATSLAGAYVTFDNLVASDNVGVTERPCVPESGNLFRTGYTPVTCTAWDAAGNSAALSFQVYVIGAHEQIGALMDEIKTELDLPNGTLQPLLNQLKLAFTQTADGGAACKKVTDFINMVQTKSFNLSPEDAAMLTEDATRIMHVMGCPAPAPTVKQLASYQQPSIQ